MGNANNKEKENNLKNLITDVKKLNELTFGEIFLKKTGYLINFKIQVNNPFKEILHIQNTIKCELVYF